MRRRLVVLVLAAAISFALPVGEAAGFMRPTTRAPGPRIEGKYLVHSPGGLWDLQLQTKPSGVVWGEIVARSSATTLQALGLVRGGRLYLSISSSDDGGIIVYRFADGGARGDYTTWSSRDVLGEEVLDGGPLGGPPGTYAWIARLPSPMPMPLGSGGRGVVEITMTRDVYHLDWRNGVTGYGLRNGEGGEDLAVSWASSGPHEIVMLSPAADGWRGFIAGEATDKPAEITLTR